MEKQILRLLIIDDAPDDAEATIAALRKAGYQIKSQLVSDLSGFQAAIDKNKWDLVLTEFMLPHFSAQFALDHLKHSRLDIPLIVVTREINDPDLAQIMKVGAHDVVLKNQLGRLAPAAERELRVNDERRSYREVIQTLKEVEDKHRTIVSQSREAIAYFQDGMHVDANKVYLDVFGYQDVSALEGIPAMNLIEKKDQARFKEFLRQADNESSTAPQEFTALRQDGSSILVEITISAVTIKGEACTQILVNDISSRKAVETKLKYLHQHDPLTGLFNRQHFIQALTATIEKTKKDNTVSGVIYIDLHQMKEVNTRFGHAVGDRLLLNIVRILRQTLGEKPLIARFRESEIALLLNDANEIQLQEIVSNIQKSLKAKPFKDGNKEIPCDFYLARALVNKTTESSQKLLAGLFKEVEAKRPKPVAPEPATVAPTQKPTAPAATERRQSDWRERLRTAIKNDGFQLNYQPVVNLHGEPAEYFEVLIRMVGRNDEIIPAAEFMSSAESSGLSMEVDRWVVRRAIQALADLHREGRQATFFLNLSSTALVDDLLLAILPRTLKETGVASNHIILELEETAVIENLAKATGFIQTIKKLGFGLVIDNFGKSPGELDHLRPLKVDYLKIDGNLIRNARSGDNKSQGLITAALEAAKTLNAKTIAKSVESADILSFLWQLGVDYAQGHYFQQPDAAIGYDFEGETTLSSDTSQPGWTSSKNEKSR